MSRQKMVWTAAIVVAAGVLTAASSANADVVSGSLLYFDAANADGAGGAGHLGSGLTWRNLGSTGVTHDAVLETSTYDGNSRGYLPTWAGAGTAADPYTVQFRPGTGVNKESGYAKILNSYDASSDLNMQVFTYEVWAKINGGSVADAATLIQHNSNGSDQGNGAIAYSVTGVYPYPANDLFTQGGAYPDVYGLALFPNSTGIPSMGGFHQLVFTRAGDGATDSAFYLDGVLQGTFQSGSGSSIDSWMCLGATNWSTNFVNTPNADIAIARVYGAALTDAGVLQNYNADSARFTPTPEPGMLVLAATGLLGLLAYAWRRRK